MQMQTQIGDDPSVKEMTIDDGVGYNSNTAKKARLQSMLSALLDDPILSDVPKKPALADVDTLISLEMGSAMRISILKMDNTTFDVAVLNSATVKDLKLAIKKKTNEMEQAHMGHRHISWRHVWANFCLSHLNEKLIDDNSVLQDFGIRNNSQVNPGFLLNGAVFLHAAEGCKGAFCSLCNVKSISETFPAKKTQVLSWLEQAFVN